MKAKNGFSFVDVVVGVSLMLIVFSGIFAAFRLGMKVVGQSKYKISATAIAQGELEKIRNLSYDNTGIINGFPEGLLEADSSASLNNVEFTIERRVEHVIDDADGIGSVESPDDCPFDYKKAEVKVSWSGRFAGDVTMTADIAPKNLVQECAAEGGILSVSVFDAFGIMVDAPLIEVKDPETDDTLKSAMPASGQHYFSLVSAVYPAAYKVVVSKLDGNYSVERTYSSDEVATPEKPHPLLQENIVEGVSLSIDELSSFTVNSKSLWSQDLFSDSFLDDAKIYQVSDVERGDGDVKLAMLGEEYSASGFLISVEIVPAALASWQELVFTDLEPADTDLKYQIFYDDGEDWLLIPDEDLANNSVGFEVSPVDLSGLDPVTYYSLKLRANFSTTNAAVSPTLKDWQISWITTASVFIGSVDFSLRGDKIIGTDGAENPVYKYSQSHATDGSGQLNILNLAWDAYTFSADDLDLMAIDPAPQPISLPPDGANISVDLYLQAENSLLATVQNQTTLEPIFAATVRLYNIELLYDVTQYTDSNGQTYFIPLENNNNYTLELEAAGYSSATVEDVAVLEDATKIVKMQQIE